VNCTIDIVWERVLSKSYISQLPATEQEKLKERVYRLLREKVPQFAPGSPADATVPYPYDTDVVITVRK
jgi:hypothetical protein